MPIFSFLLDCSHQRKAGSILGFCLSHGVICLMLMILSVYFAGGINSLNGLNGARRLSMMYLNLITMLPIMQKKLHAGFYALCPLSILGSLLGGIVLGILPVAYLLRKPNKQNAAPAS